MLVPLILACTSDCSLFSDMETTTEMKWQAGAWVFSSYGGFTSYDGDLSLPLDLALGSPIFPSGCEGKLGVALESPQGRRDLT